MKADDNLKIKDIFINRLTLQIQPQGDLLQFYNHAREVAESLKSLLTALPYAHGERYRANFQLVAEKSNWCSLQFDPLIATNAPMILDCKPVLIGYEGTGNLKRVLKELLGPSYEKCMHELTISRIEIGVDIPGAKLEELLFLDDTKRSSSMSFDKTGKLVGLNLGSPTSARYIVITNETGAVGVRSRPKGLFDPPEPRVQIRSLIKTEPTRAAALLSGQNPFAGIYAVWVPTGPSKWMTPSWLGFIDSCRARGMQAALARISDIELRKKYRKRICRTFRAGWWKPNKMWKRVPSALARLGLFDPAELAQPTTAPSAIIAGTAAVTTART
jgi:hypothetical protein